MFDFLLCRQRGGQDQSSACVYDLQAVELAFAMEADAELLQASVSLLAKFTCMREPNVNYLQPAGSETTCSAWLRSQPLHQHHPQVSLALSTSRLFCKAAMLHKLCKYERCDVPVMSCGSTTS